MVYTPIPIPTLESLGLVDFDISNETPENAPGKDLSFWWNYPIYFPASGIAMFHDTTMRMTLSVGMSTLLGWPTPSNVTRCARNRSRDPI